MSGWDGREVKLPEGQTWQCTGACRWLFTYSAAPPKLQQEWRCQETGEIEWLDVPSIVAPPPSSEGGEHAGS